MKIETKAVKAKFQPFTLQITIENEAELAGLWMYLNLPFSVIKKENRPAETPAKTWCLDHGETLPSQFFTVVHDKVEEIVAKETV